MRNGWQWLAAWTEGGSQDRLLIGACLLLLLADAIFIGSHAVRFICIRFDLDGGFLLHPAFSLQAPESFGETFNGVQILLLAGLLLRLGLGLREPVYLAWALAFVAVLIDDVLAVNQWLGAYVAYGLGLHDTYGITSQDLAELVVYAAGGGAIVAVVYGAASRATEPHRIAALVLAALFGLLLVFAIGGDLLLHKYMRTFSGSQLLFEVFEEGGEMFAVSLTLAFTLVLTRLSLQSPAPALRPAAASAGG